MDIFILKGCSYCDTEKPEFPAVQFISQTKASVSVLLGDQMIDNKDAEEYTDQLGDVEEINAKEEILDQLKLDFSNSADQKQEVLKKLLAVKTEYDACTKSPQTSPQANALLHKNSFRDIEALIHNIDSINLKIKEYESFGLQYIFNVIDYDKAQLNSMHGEIERLTNKLQIMSNKLNIHLNKKNHKEGYEE